MWTTLKQAVAAIVKTNGNQEITGALLQQTLNSIINTVGENATFKGVAVPTTVPGTPDGKLFYLAMTPGVYANFGGIEIKRNSLNVLLFDGSAWSRQTAFYPYYFGTYHLQNDNQLQFNGKTITIPGMRRVNHKGKWDETDQSYTFDLSGEYDYLLIGTDGFISGGVGKLVITKGTQSYFWAEPEENAKDVLIYSDGGFWKSQIPEIQIQLDKFYNPVQTSETVYYPMGVNFTGNGNFGVIKKAFFNNQTVEKDGYLSNLKIKTLFNGEIYLIVLRPGLTVGKWLTEALRTTLTVKSGTTEIRGLRVPVKSGDYIAIAGVDGNTIKGFIESTGIGRYETDLNDPLTGTFYCTTQVLQKDITFQYQFNVISNSVIGMPEIIESQKNIESVLAVSIDATNYGNYNSAYIGNYFPREPHVDFSATTTNSESPKDGYLTEVSARVKNGGTFVFKIGLLDQYPRFVVSRSFELTLADGLNTIDVSEMNIPIAKGEQLAISCTDKAVDGTGSINYNVNSVAIPNELFYGQNNGTWSKLATEFGGELVLAYKIKEVDTILASKESVEQVKTLVDNQAKQISRLQYVYDENGTPYKLAIIGGEITIKSVQYKNVFALGNSLTSHGFNLGIGYHGDDSWAMASTNKVTTTWTKHLQTILRQKQETAVVTPFNIAAWETNYMGVDLSALFTSHIGTNYDLIVFRAGENGTAGADYTDGVDRLITFLRANFPQADIIMTDMFWHNTYKQDSFKAIADKYVYPYITFGNINDFCLLGQMTMGVDDIFYPIIHNGVAGHCTDVCFFDFANILANSLGYTEITGKHTLNIGTTSTDYAVNSLTQIKDGYVSILTYGANAPTIVATGVTSSNVIAVTHHDIKATTWINTPSKIPTFVTTFLMPDENVNITIS